jgi:hypothetical protein
MLFELITAGVGMVAFVAAFFVAIPDQALVQITIALLALLAVTSLLQRVTTIDSIKSNLLELQRYVTQGRAKSLDEQLRRTNSSIVAPMEEIRQFLRDGELDRRLEKSATASNAILENLQGAGIHWAYETLGDVSIARELGKANTRIRILSNWVGCLNEIGETLIRKAESGCRVDVLVLQHSSEFAQIRSMELGWKESLAVSRQISGELETIDRLLSEHPAAKAFLTVKAFDARPPVCIFAYDDTRFMGNFWPRVNAMDGPFLKVLGSPEGETSTLLSRIVDSQFDELWNAKKTRYVRLVGSKPSYVDSVDLAWLDERLYEKTLRELDETITKNKSEGRSDYLNFLDGDDRKNQATLAVRDALAANDFAASWRLAGVFEDTGNAAAIESLFYEAIDRGYLPFIRGLVSHLEGQGRMDEVEDILRKGVEAGDSFSHLKLSEVLEHRGHLQEAQSVLEHAVTRGDVFARGQLTAFLDRLGKPEVAIDLLARWVSLGNVGSRYELAQRLVAAGRNSEAENVLREGAEAGSRLCWLTLTDLLQRTGRGSNELLTEPGLRSGNIEELESWGTDHSGKFEEDHDA